MYVSSVSIRTHVAIVFIWMLHMFHTYVACAFIWMFVYGCNGFQVFFRCFSSVLEACFKCLNCLQTYVATVVFGCLKRISGVASLLAFCYMVLVCPPHGADRASLRRCGQILPNRRRRLLLFLSLRRHRLRVEHAKRGATCEHPSRRPDANTADVLSAQIRWIS